MNNLTISLEKVPEGNNPPELEKRIDDLIDDLTINVLNKEVTGSGSNKYINISVELSRDIPSDLRDKVYFSVSDDTDRYIFVDPPDVTASHQIISENSTVLLLRFSADIGN